MTILRSLLVAGVALAATATAANATTAIFVSNIVPLATTNFSGVALNLQQFNPAWGTLTGISVHLHGDILGSARAESVDAAPATLTLNLSATLTLQRPDLSTIVVTTPIVNDIFFATAFDGLIDFGGTSGVAFLNQAASRDTTVALTAGDFLLFTGLGNVSGLLNGSGASVGTGAGNLVTFFTTQAGGYADVTYTYTPTIRTPEPAALALLGLGMGVLGFARRRAA